MWHNEKKHQPGGGLRGGMSLRVAGILASLAILTEPALAQAPNPLLPHNLSPWGMFLNADIVVKAVMVGLAFASLLTWTVWLAKAIELLMARRRMQTGLAALTASRSLP